MMNLFNAADAHITAALEGLFGDAPPQGLEQLQGRIRGAAEDLRAIGCEAHALVLHGRADALRVPPVADSNKTDPELTKLYAWVSAELSLASLVVVGAHIERMRDKILQGA